MRARREPAAPPEIPGFEYVRLLGLGGFADVFEYSQELPARSVAVKVMLANALDDASRQRFFAEANLMAQLSHHPSIVTIHHADIARDGRPYLVMEYCSRPGLGSRYRAERITVTEALRTGIRLASAVEAAHRLGILHRDIKPANILTTDYGYPALTDFGIAATMGGDGAAGTGMSIPWSPPELLAENPTGDIRGDIYSLGATIYSMLAGRSPFEALGQPNGAADLINRIERSPLPSIDRDDVPPTLEALLARTMSKDPLRRYPSALAVAHALQQVERSLGLTVTQIDMPEDPNEKTVPRIALTRRPQEGEATRVRPIVSIDPSGPAAAAPSPQSPPVAQSAAAVWQASPSAPSPTAASPTAASASGTPLVGYPAASAQNRRPTRAPRPAPRGSSQHSGRGAKEAEAPRRRTGAIVASIIAAAVVLAVLIVVPLLTVDREPKRPTAASPTLTATVSPTGLGPAVVPAPVNLAATTQSDGSIRFVWTNPDPRDGDRYLWGLAEAEKRATVDVPSVLVPAPADPKPVCIEVSIVRSNGQFSATPAKVCSA